MKYRLDVGWRKSCRLTAAALTFSMFIGAAGLLLADDGESGSGSRLFRNQALQSVPFQQLNEPTREKISDILQRPSLYRRLPVITIAADPDYFRFLVRYPEVIVNIWQLMGVTQMTTERTGAFTIDTDDGAGTQSSLELIYGNENLHIFYGTGTYEGPVIRRKLTGSCVLILRTDYSRNGQGLPQATSQLDVFLRVDNATLGLVTKTIQPIVGSTADHNFTETVKFVQRLNETTEHNGPGVQQMANRLDIDDDVRQRFIEMAGMVYSRAERSLLGPVKVPTAASQSSYQNSSYPGWKQSDSSNQESSYRESKPADPYSPPPNRIPSIYERSGSAVYRRIGDQRISSRPSGYSAPNYDPVRRY